MSKARSVPVSQRAQLDIFDEDAYLAGNPDVAKAVRDGLMPSGRVHFERHGHRAPRYMRFPDRIPPLRAAKLEKLAPFLRKDMASNLNAGTYDYLNDELRSLSRIKDTDKISSHPYDADIMAVVNRCADGLVLDCGAGCRDTYFDNVVNFEIVDYDTTDVLGVGEKLPFVDDAFDAVISVAVLEHVRDPFACAAEIVRVLKPGGLLYCSVPFLQPEHGYPNHYYNMAPQGLRALFEDNLQVIDQRVTDFIGPIHALVWILAAWQKGLTGDVKDRFLDMRVRDFMVGARSFHNADFVTGLSPEKKLELACATTITAVKPTRPVFGADL